MYGGANNQFKKVQCNIEVGHAATQKTKSTLSKKLMNWICKNIWVFFFALLGIEMNSHYLTVKCKRLIYFQKICPNENFENVRNLRKLEVKFR